LSIIWTYNLFSLKEFVIITAVILKK
jgi:hypothetical protein